MAAQLAAFRSGVQDVMPVQALASFSALELQVASSGLARGWRAGGKGRGAGGLRAGDLGVCGGGRRPCYSALVPEETEIEAQTEGHC